MRFKLTLLLLILNAVVFAVLYYMDKRVAASKRYAMEQRVLFAGDLLQSADRISFESTELPDESWTLRKQGGEWRMQTPLEWRANSFSVNRLFAELQLMRWENRFSLSELKDYGQSLADYGLQEPKVVFRVGNANTEKTLQVGIATEAGERLYAKVADEDYVMVLPTTLFAGESLRLPNLLAREVISLKPFEITSITLQAANSPNQRIRLAKGAGNHWLFESPIQTPADDTRVEAALSGLLTIIAEAFPEDVDLDDLQNNPAFRLTLGAGVRRQTLLIGASGPAGEGDALRYAQLEDMPTAFLLDIKPLADLLNPQERLRDPHIFPLLDRTSISSLEFVSPSASCTVQRLENGGWTVLSGRNGSLVNWPADTETVEKVLQALVDLQAEAIVTDAPSQNDLEDAGLTRPALRITFRESSERNLLIGKIDEAKRLAVVKRGSLPTISKVSVGALELFSADPLFYRHKTYSTLPGSAQIVGVSITTAEGAPLLAYASQSDGSLADWMGRMDADKAKAAEALLAQIRAFKVTRYHAANPDQLMLPEGATSVEWPWRLTVNVSLPAGGSSQSNQITYLVSKRYGGDLQYASVGNDGLCFELPVAFIEALHAFVFTETAPEPKE